VGEQRTRARPRASADACLPPPLKGREDMAQTDETVAEIGKIALPVAAGDAWL